MQGGLTEELMPVAGPELSALLLEMRAIRQFALDLSRGDLNQELLVKGQLAGSLKALQANLRHLTWQVQQVARGDMNQRVEFMGEFSQAFNIMLDNLREARDALQASEARYRSIVVTSPDDITIINLDNLIEYVSPAALQMFGYEQEGELISKSIFDLVAPPDRTALQTIFEQLLQGQHSGQFEFRALCKNGSLLDVDVRSDIIRTPVGEPSQVLLLIRDISARKAMERCLAENEARYRLLAENANDVIWTMDLLGRFTYVSPAVKRLRGYTPEEVIQQTIEEALTPASAEIARSALAYLMARMAAGESIDGGRFELEQPVKGGGTVWTETMINPMVDDAGAFIGLLGVTRDISEQRQAKLAELEQRTLAEALRDSAAALNSALGLEQVLEVILHNVERVVPHDTVDVMLLDEKGVARVERAHGYDNFKPGSREFVQSLRLPLAEIANLRQMAESRQPLIIENILNYSWLETPNTMWVRSHLGAPILVDNEVVGFIVLLSARVGFFNAEQANRLQAFANQAAVAIQKARLFEQLNMLATIDSLTNIANRRYFFERAELEFERALRYNKPLSALMLDIDNFKIINDTYGHAVGDQILKDVAAVCTRSLRKLDLLGRYGGEEFALLLPETNCVAAVEAAERLRRTIAAERFHIKQGALSLTVSIGVVELSPRVSSFRSLLDLADEALYQAKNNGRNQVVFY